MLWRGSAPTPQHARSCDDLGCAKKNLGGKCRPGGNCSDLVSEAPVGRTNRQETLVKYMLLIYNNPEALAALPESERNAIFADVDVIMTELKASGELVGGEALAHPASTKTVRPVGGT